MHGLIDPGALDELSVRSWQRVAWPWNDLLESVLDQLPGVSPQCRRDAITIATTRHGTEHDIRRLVLHGYLLHRVGEVRPIF
jgi:hypothetical protein